MGSKSTGSEWKDRESGQNRGDTTMGKSYGSGTDPRLRTNILVRDVARNTPVRMSWTDITRKFMG